MPVQCPKCHKDLPPEDVNVGKDVAFCRSCNEAFELSMLVEEEAAAKLGPMRVSQPANTRVTLLRDEQRIALTLPPGGFKGTGCFFTLFSGFWNLITWGVFLGFVLSMAGTMPAKGPQNPWMLLFFIPHMSVGAITAVIALYCVKGDLAVAMDKNAVMIQRRLLGYTWSRTMPFDAITDVRMHTAYTSNNRPVMGVAFIFDGDARSTQPNAGAVQKALKGRPMNFGSGLNDEEKHWLVGEFYDFWRENRKS